MLLDGPGAKVTPDAAAAACDAIRDDVHQVQPAALSITNATEYGLVYRAAEVAALGELAKQRGLAFHMDGARFANALATTGESPADVTWRAGVDALSFGFVKNGGLNAEALILFRTELADEIAVRRKRAGHLALQGPDARRAAPRACSRTGCGSTMPAPPTAPRRRWRKRRRTGWSTRSRPTSCSSAPATTKRSGCERQGFDFYDWGPGEIRLVTSWDQAPRPSTGSPRRSPPCERSAGGQLPHRHAAVHHLHRDLGLDLDRDPRPARASSRRNGR